MDTTRAMVQQTQESDHTKTSKALETQIKRKVVQFQNIPNLKQNNVNNKGKEKEDSNHYNTTIPKIKVTRRPSWI